MVHEVVLEEQDLLSLGIPVTLKQPDLNMITPKLMGGQCTSNWNHPEEAAADSPSDSEVVVVVDTAVVVDLAEADSGLVVAVDAEAEGGEDEDEEDEDEEDDEESGRINPRPLLINWTPTWTHTLAGKMNQLQDNPLLRPTTDNPNPPQMVIRQKKKKRKLNK